TEFHREIACGVRTEESTFNVSAPQGHARCQLNNGEILPEKKAYLVHEPDDDENGMECQVASSCSDGTECQEGDNSDGIFWSQGLQIFGAFDPRIHEVQPQAKSNKAKKPNAP